MADSKSLVVMLLAFATTALGLPGGFGGGSAYNSIGGGGGSQYKSQPIPYEFSYNVNDAYKGLDFGQQESSDGNAVYGSYTVALPDGRTQQVEYRADHVNGYVAKVNYIGEAQHPQTYGPAITFRPSYGSGNQGSSGNHGGSGFGHGGSGSHGGSGFGHGGSGGFNSGYGR